MRNFSNEGFYIETSYKYKSGNILIVRIVNYLTNPLSDTENEQPRSISLAKVKWHQKISCENIIKYGMGMEYIDWQCKGIWNNFIKNPSGQY